MQPAHTQDSTSANSILTVALELASKHWKVALQDDTHARPAVHTTKQEGAAERLDEAVALVEDAKRQWRLPSSCRTVVLYEAGQDAFWIARALQEKGYEVVVVDPASIPVERQARRAKTDRLDAIRLMSCLRGWLRGERDRLHAVRVPTAEAEDMRHLVRDRGQLQKEVGQHRDRICKLLRTVGCWIRIGPGFAEQLERNAITCHNGVALPQYLRQRLILECQRLALAARQLKELEASLPQQLPPAAAQSATTLQRLRGIGPVGAHRLVLELFWRHFDNARQVGSCVGLVPQPYDSGQSRIDQGISKQGNRRVRALLIEMAWMWIRHQPGSALTRWFLRRTGSGSIDPAAGKRGKRVGIVAVARKLVIALWRYLKDALVPEGAELKAKMV
ncbi:IS110 family transposase [Massilia sp. Mn16-1_5]|uniref:IS110 family transposase n=1 Tax=Massilia sp. Mn16-1_5 TaxID=2079199 RepID=UPI00109E3926|nr:IS110 family transposase [Massilia sp. Mn16-1_5]THC39477.1 IS110 family transposase [Massilia sp. Mn16-1_5]